MTYYNTTNLTGEALQDEEREAVTQENAVQAFFNQHPGEKFLSSDVHYHLVARRKIPERTQVQSIRRAMSNLKKANRLEILPETSIGHHGYGKSEHYYQLSTWAPAGYSEQHPVTIIEHGKD